VFALIPRHERGDLYVRPTDLLSPVFEDRDGHHHIERFCGRGDGNLAEQAPWKNYREAEQGK
jgi:hypothetical protein